MFAKLSSLELFNLMQRKYSNRSRDEICIIDCRRHNLYLENHIKTSISIPPTKSQDLSIIIDEIPLQVQKLSLSYDTLKKLHLIVLIYSTEDKEESFPWSSLLSNLLKRKNFSSCLLTDTFEQFSERYPFLIKSSLSSSSQLQNQSNIIDIENNNHNNNIDVGGGEDNKTSHQLELIDGKKTIDDEIGYPTELIRNFFYLGRLVHALSEKIVRDLKITHIVCIHDENDEPKNPFSFIQYHNIPLDDTPTSPIANYFDDFLAFMKGIDQSNSERCLLHCNLGISRSCSFAILFFMIYYHRPLSYSEKYITSQHIDCYPNKGFYASLQSVEKSYFNLPSRSLPFLQKDTSGKLVPREGVSRVSPFRLHGSEIIDLLNRTQAPEWVDSDFITNCHGCGVLFTVTNRKHHCRHCGNVFCGVCCSNRIAIPRMNFPKPVRACLQCYAYLTKPSLSQSASIGDISR